ncbi:F0F1 ATP synthase subunit B [Longirhabdus pacifica]|uniref:F0F1 ATP synthase subunit B n=1 Tax=Longirhabdus pacifica TaxID=2305227 RepID=UPI0010087D29|nr:F0F1 ATP synthase subunit B [Longirhabdus pacifica]
MEFVPSNTFVAIIAFGILYFLLHRYAFGPLFSVMEKRKEHVQNEIKQAEKSRTDAEQFLTDQKKAIDDARKEAFEIIEQARKTSTSQADDIVAKAKEEADRMKEAAIAEIESEKNKAVAQLKNQVSAMSVLIASKIIEKQVDEKSQKQLIDSYLTKVGDK